jgi:hypothetical protein
LKEKTNQITSCCFDLKMGERSMIPAMLSGDGKQEDCAGQPLFSFCFIGIRKGPE